MKINIPDTITIEFTQEEVELLTILLGYVNTHKSGKGGKTLSNIGWALAGYVHKVDMDYARLSFLDSDTDQVVIDKYLEILIDAKEKT